MSNIILRSISALILIFIVGSVFLIGPNAVILMSGLITLILFGETLKGIGSYKSNKILLVPPFIGLVSPVFFYNDLHVIFLLSIILLISFNPKKFRLLRLSAFCYIFLAQYLFLTVICEIPNGLNLQQPFLLLMLVIASDIGGYIFGKLFCNNSLAPKVSPNKTWEGSFGSCVLSVVVWLIFFKGFADNLILELILVMFICVCAQIGDLVVSYTKRVLLLKDSGIIIPGHGGMFDRLDSVLGVIFGYSFLIKLGYGF